jgi:hypothetical protein
MKKTNLIWIIAMILLVGTVFAKTTITPTALVANDTIWRQQVNVLYTEDELNHANPPLLFYIKYDCGDIATWNTRVNELYNNTIQNITLNLWYDTANGRTTEELSFTADNTPFSDNYKFFYLYPQESQLVILDTQYTNNLSINNLQDSPCTFATYLGSKGCDRCQEYNYVKHEQDLLERETVTTYNTNIKDKIKQFFQIQYEFAIMIYWVAMIAIFLFVISTMIYGIFFLVHFFRHFFKGK